MSCYFFVRTLIRILVVNKMDPQKQAVGTKSCMYVFATILLP